MDKKINKKELRSGFEFEMRTVKSEDDPNKEEMYLEGYALKFNVETVIGSPTYGFREIILPEALDTADMKKVPLKYNHDDSYLALASTKNGSLELEVDEVGLKFKGKLIPTQSNRDIYLSVKEGLISECSFAFTIDYNNEGSEWDWSEDLPLRKVKKIERLFDIALVDLPAYDQTSVFARSLSVFEDQKKAFEDEKRAKNKKTLAMLMKIKIAKEGVK